MGSGYKDFAPGDVLTAADVDGYLMRQTVMTFSNASARNTALSGVLDEGMVAYLEDSDIVTFYNGSAWLEMMSESQTWTPAWTNVTVGNGTLTAFYQRNVDLVSVQVKLVFGSTTAFTGSIQMSLPIAPTDTDEAVNTLSGYARAASTGSGTTPISFKKLGSSAGAARTLQIVEVYTSGSEVRWANDYAAVDATHPFTWATTDVFVFGGTYRVGS
tara:strand:+ start:3896 stop:4540 length:645 start_codon:yes stop_codon:yes gene_type:complete